MTITIIVDDKYQDVLTRSLSVYGPDVMKELLENWLVDQQKSFDAQDASDYFAAYKALPTDQQAAVTAAVAPLLSATLAKGKP